MIPISSQLPPNWVLPAMLEDLAAVTSDLEALAMCVQRVRRDGDGPHADDAARLWAFVEEVRGGAALLRERADELARELLGSFLTPDGWPLSADEAVEFREGLAARHAARASYERQMADAAAETSCR
jgi:hypothetical protein